MSKLVDLDFSELAYREWSTDFSLCEELPSSSLCASWMTKISKLEDLWVFFNELRLPLEASESRVCEM